MTNGNCKSESTSSSSAYSSRPLSEISFNEQPESEVLNLSVFINHPFYKFDLDLLKAVDIGSTADLMVEMKKMKYWSFVSFSEKVNELNRFEILSISYPL